MSALGERRLPRTGQGGGLPFEQHPFQNFISEGRTRQAAQQIKRLTNLMELTVDTSWWTRYRSRTKNPDFGDTFPQAIPGLAQGKFPAIPRSNADLKPAHHLQAIANTAGFHFATIEQGGTSVYPALAQRVTNVEVLRILLSIGPTETCHFQTWHDKAGNIIPLKDPTNGLVFPDLNKSPFGGEDFQTNLIMPEPTVFLSKTLPPCSIIRPTATTGAAMAALNALTSDGLFIGQRPLFFSTLQVWQRRQMRPSEESETSNHRCRGVRYTATALPSTAVTWRDRTWACCPVSASLLISP
jgi:hypothetical protein